MTHHLYVHTEGIPVGEISYEPIENTYSFQYDAAWVRAPAGFNLAPAVPLPPGEARPGAVHRFLENLLPEGRALDIASILNQVSKNNVFALVRLLGQEPVGAFSFKAAEHPLTTAPAQRRPISAEELSHRIRERDSVPFPVWDGKVRLSVAGYQDKLQVLVEDDQLSLADGSLSSTHLLKPESRNPTMPHLVANEHYCMRLAALVNAAARLGLPVAGVELRRIPEPILLIERFDRVVQWAAPGRVATVARTHIIDGCQALDLPSTLKYERNFGSSPDVRHIRDGVSFERLFGLLDKMVTPASARTYLLRWALVQLLLGNSDAHGKNISFYVRRAGLVPAPMYDLVSVNAYGETVEQEMALAYGDEFLPEAITPYALADFAYRTGTQPAALARELSTIARAMRRLAPEQAQDAVYVGDERAVVHRVAEHVCRQADRLLALASEVPKVDRRLFQ